MPRPNTDGGYLLPENVDPDRRCVQLWIPDDPNHIHAFWGALLDLARWFSWQRDLSHTGTVVARVWKEIIDEAWERFYSDDPCPCEEDFMSDCCDPILEKLDRIITLLGGLGGTVSMQERSRITEIVINIGGTTVITDLHLSTPDLTYTTATDDTGGDLVNRQAALCSVAATFAHRIRNEALQDALEAGVASSVTFGALPFVGWIEAVVFGVLTGASYLLSEYVFISQEVTDEFVCCWASAMEDLPTTKANAIAAAQSCDLGWPYNLIKDLVVWALTDDANWGAFAHDLGAAFAALDAGAVFDCPCDVVGDVCDQEGTVVGIDLALNPPTSGLTLDDDLGSCASFARRISGGLTFEGASAFCLHTFQLRRGFGNPISGEAESARLTVNGVTFSVAVPHVAGDAGNVTFTISPHQVMGPDQEVRVDLLGGDGTICIGSVRFTGVPVS